MNETELHLERLIAAPPERVYALWTDPALLVKWWGPEGHDVPASALDVRPGGKWRTTMRSPEGKTHTVSGIYRVLDPPKRLVFTWAWENEQGQRGHETEVSVTFTAAPGGTRLVLLQKEFESVNARDLHNTGWSSALNCLEKAA